MKAGIFYGPGDVRYEEIETPKLEPGDEFDVLIHVMAAGVCGSDMHYYKGEAPEALRERAVLGHELSGVVLEVGVNVTNVKPGDRVGVEPLIGCGVCAYCLSGDYHLCQSLKHIGYFYGGGFAEYVKAPHGKVYLLPDSVSFEEASTLDCYAVAVHAMKRVAVNIHDFVVVIGAGPLGICTAQVAQAAGARKVILVDLIEEILALARQSGINDTINSSQGNIVEEIMRLTGGKGADIVFETVGGNAPTLDQSVEMVRYGGTVGLIGMRNRSTIDFWKAHGKELNLTFIYSYAYWNYATEFEIALQMMADRHLNAKPMITHRFPMSRIKEAFDTTLNKQSSKAIKVVVIHDK